MRASTSRLSNRSANASCSPGQDTNNFPHRNLPANSVPAETQIEILTIRCVYMGKFPFYHEGYSKKYNQGQQCQEIISPFGAPIPVHYSSWPARCLSWHYFCRVTRMLRRPHSLRVSMAAFRSATGKCIPTGTPHRLIGTAAQPHCHLTPAHIPVSTTAMQPATAYCR